MTDEYVPYIPYIDWIKQSRLIRTKCGYSIYDYIKLIFILEQDNRF